MKNTITITADDKGLTMESNPPIAFDEFMTLTCTALLNVMNDMLSRAPEGHEKDCKGFIYDSVNVAVSKVLERFAPEFELRPNLTAKAIKEAEDRIIMEGRLNEVEPNT